MNNKFKEFVKSRIVYIGCTVLLIVIYLYHIDFANVIYHLGDEFGYWANAAFFAGYDWSEVASYNTYYSFGYSLILTPLFLIEDFVLRYHIAICMNVFMQIICQFLIYNLCRSIFEYVSKSVLFVISTVTTLYSSNVFFAKNTLTESFIYFCFVVIVYFLYKVCKTGKLVYYLGLGFMASYIFAVHMRALGISISVIIFLLLDYIFIREKRKYITLTLIEIGVIFICMNVVKEIIKDNLYCNNPTLEWNDFAGQANKLSLLLSFEGVVLLIKSILGKIYYLLSSTCLVAAWGMYWIWAQIRNIVKKIKNNITVEQKLALFLLMSFCATITISGIYMIEESEVIDHLIYGRYNEYILGPIIAFSLVYLYQNFEYKKYFIILCIYVILGIFVSVAFGTFENPQIREVNIAGIVAFSYDGVTCLYDKWEMVITLKVVLVSTALVIIDRLLRNKGTRGYVSLILLAVIWGISGNFVLDYQMHYRESYYTGRTITDFAIENDIDEITYLTNGGYVYFDFLRPDILQFMYPRLKIKYKNIAQTDLTDEIVFFVRKNRFDESIFNNFILVGECADFKLYMRK